MSKTNQEQHDVIETDKAFARESHGGLVLLFQIFMERKWLIVGVLVISLVLAGSYLRKVVPVYSSSSKVYVEQAGPKLLDNEPGIMTQAKNYLYTQCSLMTSDMVLKKVVEDPTISDLKSLSQSKDKTGYLKGIIATEVGKKDDIIRVSCSVPYPGEAADIVNAVVRSYISYHADRKAFISEEIRRVLEAERKKQYDELEKMRQQIVEQEKAGLVADPSIVTDRQPQPQTEVERLGRQVPVPGSRNAGLDLMLLDFQWQQSRCDTIDSRISELNASESAGVLNITVFEAAKPSSAAIKPHGSRIIAIAIIAGLAVGCLLALLVDMVINKDKGISGRSGGFGK